MGASLHSRRGAWAAYRQQTPPPPPGYSPTGCEALTAFGGPLNGSQPLRDSQSPGGLPESDCFAAPFILCVVPSSREPGPLKRLASRSRR